MINPKAQRFRGLIESESLSRESSNLVSMNEAQELLNLSRSGILYQIRLGKLKANKIGGKWWIEV